jgi:hypothetical protein
VVVEFAFLKSNDLSLLLALDCPIIQIVTTTEVHTHSDVQFSITACTQTHRKSPTNPCARSSNDGHSLNTKLSTQRRLFEVPWFVANRCISAQRARMGRECLRELDHRAQRYPSANNHGSLQHTWDILNSHFTSETELLRGRIPQVSSKML